METGVPAVQAMEISIRMRYAAISMRASVLFMTSVTLPPVVVQSWRCISNVLMMTSVFRTQPHQASRMCKDDTAIPRDAETVGSCQFVDRKIKHGGVCCDRIDTVALIATR